MNKALSIALLFAAAALVAANGTVNINVPNPHAAVNSVSASISELHKSLQAVTAKNVDLSKCECAKSCDDKKQEYCKTTTEMVEECEDVEGTKEFIECKTKCFTADHVIEVNVPTIDLNNKGRRLFESEPVTKNGQVVLQHPLGHILGGAAAGGAASGAAAGAGAAAAGPKGKEICREICTPGTRTVTEKVCEEVPKKKYDCEEKVIYSSCKNVCKCPNGVTVETKESPNLMALGIAAAGTGHHAKAALAGAAVQAMNAMP